MCASDSTVNVSCPYFRKGLRLGEFFENVASTLHTFSAYRYRKQRLRGSVCVCVCAFECFIGTDVPVYAIFQCCTFESPVCFLPWFLHNLKVAINQTQNLLNGKRLNHNQIH